MSRYDQIYEGLEKRKNMGHDYHGEFFIKLFSQRLWKNSIVSGFLFKMEPIVIDWIDSVKVLKNYKNYIIKKDDKRIN